MSKKCLTVALLLFSIALFTGIALAAVDYNNLQQLSNEEFVTKVNIYDTTPADLDKVLAELKRRYPNHDDRIKAIAQMYVGANYYTEPFVVDEKTNWFPYDKTNCTMFVLYTTAMLNSGTYQEALEHMRFLHYRGGVVDYKNRYHFTEDRISDPNNQYFTNVTEQYVKDPSALGTVTLTLNKKADGTLLFGDKLGTWTREVTMKYIKREGFKPEMLKALPKAIGVAFVKKSNWKIGVIVGHEGLLIDGGDLYHSSSPTTGLILSKNYLANEFANSSWEGMFLFTLNEVILPEPDDCCR